MKRLKKIAIWAALGILGSFLLALLYYTFFSLVFPTDLERQMMVQNKLMRAELPRIEDKADMVRDEIEFLRDRDDSIYKSLFKTVAAPTSPELVVRIPSEEVLEHASAVEDDWQAIFKKLENKDYVLPPLISPVRDLNFTNVGASVGERLNPFYKVAVFHDGLDIVAPMGTPVYATARGHVSNISKSDGGKGLMVEITHFNGYLTRYSHLSSIDVKLGQSVKAGTQIGSVGDSGRAFTTHLHYEVNLCGRCEDPVNYFLGSTLPYGYVKMAAMSMSSGQSLD